MMEQKFSKGSEWRKWDLHLHAPGTKLSNSYQVSNGDDIWNTYFKKLHDSDVQAFGITDYFSLDGYISVRDNYRQRYPESSKLFLPNIELRTGDVVNKAQEEVNVHLLFNPFQQDYESKIQSLLNILKTNKTDSSNRHIKAAELKNERDFMEATTTRKFIQEAFEETYGKDADLIEYVLIITAANNDGIRAEHGKLRKLLITDELDKFSDAFFGNSGNVEYFQKTDRAEDSEVYTKPKPVLSGCDAHSFKDLDEKLGKVVYNSVDGVSHEPTWIKADLTYEGLKQIIFEPLNRVYIGEEPDILRSVRENKPHYIDSLNITCTEGYNPDQHGTWFCNETIMLSKELVAIIGNKGSGKSAVTDIIGLLGNSHNQTSKSMSGKSNETLFSFLNKDKFLKSGCAKHFQGSLHWCEGESETKLLDAQVATHLPEKIEYLPQKYLERICANIADDEFRSTLNEVIFRYVKPQDRYGKTNLDELIQYRTHQALEDINQKKDELHDVNSKVIIFEKKLTQDYRHELDEKIKLKNGEIEAHSKTKPLPKQIPQKGSEELSNESVQVDLITQSITSLTEQILQLETEQITANDSLEKLNQVRQSIERAVENIESLEDKHKSILSEVGLSFNKIVSMNIDYTSIDAVIQEKKQRIQEIQTLLLNEEEIDVMYIGDDDVTDIDITRKSAKSSSLVCKKASMEAMKKDLVDRLGKPEREYQQYLNDLIVWDERDKELRGENINPKTDTLNWLNHEIENIKLVYPEDLSTARDERERISKEIFDKKCGLTQFYNTVKQSIDGEITKCRKYLGEYDITIEAGLRFNVSFLEEFLRFINQTAAGSFRGQEEGRSILRTFTDSVINWEDKDLVYKALNDINDALHYDRREDYISKDIARDVFKQMIGNQTPVVLYDYLFSFDYLDTKYDLKVDGKDLSELSPGERGGLLLIFYLMLDRQDIPLVIDQPEDNLDNKSVYEILVTFIKQAKKRRQIILVTHNPNLAVVADAEQIIHVSIDKTDGKHDFDFFSGSIENPLINQAVVDILEGTLPAFDNRRLKYRNRGKLNNKL